MREVPEIPGGLVSRSRPSQGNGRIDDIRTIADPVNKERIESSCGPPLGATLQVLFGLLTAKSQHERPCGDLQEGRQARGPSAIASYDIGWRNYTNVTG